MAASFCFLASIYAVGSKRFLAPEPVDFQLPRDPTERTEAHGDGLLILQKGSTIIFRGIFQKIKNLFRYFSSLAWHLMKQYL